VGKKEKVIVVEEMDVNIARDVEEDTDGAQDAEIKMGVVGEMNGYQ
jgi:hypothetical protein